MIDLEDALAALVEHAPEPPDVARVTRRATQRRAHRRLSALAAAAFVVAVAVGGVVVASTRGNTRKVHVGGSGLAPVAGNQSVRITLLDGSQLEISGPASLGLTDLQPGFNGALGPASGEPQWGTLGHGFSVDRNAPTDLGAVVASYATHDGHELVVHTSPAGVTAVAQYGDWWLSATWATSPPAQWTAFASELNAKETADGYLVIEPTDPSWKLGPADAPDAQLGGDAYGSGAAIGFFGPEMYPAGCPTAAEARTRTPQGWPVSLENGAWWCDADAHVRVATWDSKLVDAAVQGLRVTYTPATQAVDRITTLDGATFEVTAPSSVLDRLSLQAAVNVDGLDTPNIFNGTPNLLPITVTRAGLPDGATSPAYAGRDGHEFLSYHRSGDCECDALVAAYGQWLVEIQVGKSGNGPAMSDADRARLASLFAAHESSGGFLVIDPAPPMHLGIGPGSEVVLDGVDLLTSRPELVGCSPPNSVDAHTPDGFAVHISADAEIWCDTTAHVTVTATNDPTHALVDEVKVRRAG